MVNQADERVGMGRAVGGEQCRVGQLILDEQVEAGRETKRAAAQQGGEIGAPGG